MGLSQVRCYQKKIQTWFVQKFCLKELEQRADQFTSLFEPYLPSQSHVLDIGGGWGFYDQPLSRRGHYLTVLDVQKPGYQQAPVVIYDGNAPFPFPDKSFDASLLITMLHHTEDPEKVLTEAKRVTRGVVIVIEDVYRHSAGQLWTILRDKIYNFEYFGHPCQFKTSSSWQKLFEKLGLRVVKHEEIYTRLAGLRILNSIFILKKTYANDVRPRRDSLD